MLNSYIKWTLFPNPTHSYLMRRLFCLCKYAIAECPVSDSNSVLFVRGLPDAVLQLLLGCFVLAARRSGCAKSCKKCFNAQWKAKGSIGQQGMWEDRCSCYLFCYSSSSGRLNCEVTWIYNSLC